MTQRKKKEKKSLAMMSQYLPDDLIIEILVRLPVKSLLRFRCVSKFFYSLISHNPHFAISHFDLAAASSPSSLTHRLLYLSWDKYDSQSGSIDLDDSSVAALNLSYLPLMYTPQIMGSCRGFILLFEFLDNFLVIWNPSTRAYKQLPSTYLLGIHCTTFFGFGYDASKDDYLVVLLGSRYNSNWTSDFSLFSLRANVWITIEGTHLPYQTFTRERGTLLNGVIHWLTFRTDIKEYVILAFDLMEKSFSEVPVPPPAFATLDNCRHGWDICVLGGSLSLYTPGDDATYIWIMKEYKVVSSWSKSVAFVMPFSSDVIRPNEFFIPMYFTKSGDIVGTNDFKTGVVKFNAKGQLLHYHSFPNVPDGFYCTVVMYTESLLSFPLN